MALSDEERKRIAREAVFNAELKHNILHARNLISAAGTLFEVDERVVKLLAHIITERDDWRRRAEQHGCDVDKGDVDCG